jgi:hypothetical protein
MLWTRPSNERAGLEDKLRNFMLSPDSSKKEASPASERTNPDPGLSNGSFRKRGLSGYWATSFEILKDGRGDGVTLL